MCVSIICHGMVYECQKQVLERIDGFLISFPHMMLIDDVPKSKVISNKVYKVG